VLGRSASSYWASDEGVIDVEDNSSSSSSDGDDDASSSTAQKKVGKVAAMALVLAAIAAFAYSDAFHVYCGCVVDSEFSSFRPGADVGSIVCGFARSWGGLLG